eukprot:1158990-Pelagomonas_calceolata.AAC.7
MPGVNCRRVSRPIGACMRACPHITVWVCLPACTLLCTGTKQLGSSHCHLSLRPCSIELGRVGLYQESVGLYVPGGTAVLPSSALMLAVPAAIAGCKTIVLATPPRPDGSITPEVSLRAC